MKNINRLVAFEMSCSESAVIVEQSITGSSTSFVSLIYIAKHYPSDLGFSRKLFIKWQLTEKCWKQSSSYLLQVIG